jgi:colicin import membrane protein
LATSVVLHAAILAWALFTIQAQREMRLPDPEPIAVDLVNSSELTRLRQGARNAKQLEAQPKESPKSEPVKKEAPKPTPVAAAPPPPPPPAPEPPPPPKEEPKEEPKKEVASIPPPAPEPPPPAAVPPVPAPDEQKKLDELLKEQERQAEERRSSRRRRKAELKKKQMKRLEEEASRPSSRRSTRRRRSARKPSSRKSARKRRSQGGQARRSSSMPRISPLLNKVPDRGRAAPSVPLDEQAKEKGPVLGAPEAAIQVVGQREGDACADHPPMRAGEVERPGGGGGRAHRSDQMRLRFNPDGRWRHPANHQPAEHAVFPGGVRQRLRAVQACEPYSLPPAKYDAWKDIIMTFDPRD